MEIFKNRPFALICLAVIAISAAVYFEIGKIKFITLLMLLLLFAVAVIFALLSRRFKLRAVFCAICLFMCFLSIASQFVFVDIRRDNALSYEGSRRVKFLVTDELYAYEHSEEYGVKMLEINGEEVSLNSEVVVGFSADFNKGDIVYARAEICSGDKSIFGYQRRLDEGVYIQAVIYDPSDCIVISKGTVNAKILINTVKEKISDYTNEILGEETSAIARGFLFGDKEDISPDTLRDFRRAGISHLLAVSGFHISIIMGAVELLLRGLKLLKGIRCVVLSLVALIFLALAGFALSACRSVIMLLAVYFSYLFVKENDSLTSLFAAVAFIIIVSPHSVVDVGLWLSFLATLGIISVYIPISRLIHKRRRPGFIGTLRYGLEKIFLALLLTFICNVFICFVVWLFFGEISVVGMFANAVISPVASVFTVFVPIAALLGGAPIVGKLIVYIVCLLSKVILWLSGAFSGIEGAVVSLKYPFVGVVIALMSVAICIMLTIRLRHKWTIMLPPVAAVLCIFVIIVSYNCIFLRNTEVIYHSKGKNEMLMISENGRTSICDVSSGSYDFLSNIYGIYDKNMSTELSDYVITHYHSYYPASIEKMFGNILLHRIYLPLPTSSEEYSVMSDIVDIAEGYKIEIEFYSYGEAIDLFGDSWISVWRDESNEHGSIAVMVGGENDKATYIGGIDSSVSAFDVLSEESEHLIFGKHMGITKDKHVFEVNEEKIKCVFYSDRELFEYMKTSSEKATVTLPKEDDAPTFFELVLN